MSDVQNSAEQALGELAAAQGEINRLRIERADRLALTTSLRNERAEQQLKLEAAESQANGLRLALATSQEETANAKARALMFRGELSESAGTLLVAATTLNMAAKQRDRVTALVASWEALLAVLTKLNQPMQITAVGALEQCIRDLKAAIAIDCECKACKPQPDTKAEPRDLASALGMSDVMAYALGMRKAAKDGPRG